MITRIHLTNFKCFTSAALQLGSLNVLAGANGTGKSTFVQALLALFQSRQSGALERSRLELNGPLVDLGTAKEVLCRTSDTDFIAIGIRERSLDWTLEASIEGSSTQYSLGVSFRPSAAAVQEALRSGALASDLYYLSADRLGPQATYPMDTSDVRGNAVGRKGEFAPLLYSTSRSMLVENGHLLLEGSDKKEHADLESQFTLWMARLFPGFRAQGESMDRMDAIRLGLSLQRQIGEPVFFRPTHIGFGVSVAFPIVLSGLLASSTTTLIVENPEAHLHPSAQSLLGEFLARVAAGGAQVVVETHSDHVVNGIRVAIKNGVLSAGASRFYAFLREPMFGAHQIVDVTVHDDGTFAAQPPTFFDQADKDLRLIYGM